MPKFTDCLTREWEVRLTVGALGQVRRETGTDLGKALASEEGFAALLFGDPVALVEVLWVLCSDQARGREVDAESFARGFDGATLEKATEALLAAVADFFPRSRVATVLKSRLKNLLDSVDQAVIDSLESRNSGGGSPASSGSTPAP